MPFAKNYKGYTKSTSRQKVFSEDEVSTGRPQLSSRNETRGSNR